MASSFNDFEKRFVLAEIIKASHLDVETLAEFIKTYDVRPNWEELQLPHGRNLKQVFKATEAMLDIQLHPPELPNPPLKRKSISDLRDHVPKRLAISPHLHHHQLQASQPQHLPAMNVSHNVNIQPRPSSNGYQQLPIPLSAPSPTTAPVTTGKKRGRPSKADKEAQARANGASTGFVPAAPLPSLAPQPPPPPTPTVHAPSPPDHYPNVLSPPSTQTAYQSHPHYSQYTPSSHGGSARHAPSPVEDAARMGNLRWRPTVTGAPNHPGAERRGHRNVSEPVPQRHAAELQNSDRSERSPSVSNLITPMDPEEGGGGRQPSARGSPAVTQSGAAGQSSKGTYGGCGSGSSSTQSPLAAEHSPVINTGHNRNTLSPNRNVPNNGARP